MNAEIREIYVQDNEAYKVFLTKGLVEDEENFRITPGDDEHAPFPTTGAADSFTLGAYLDSELAGVVSFEREGKTREKLRHKGLLFRMYVSPLHRGHGIGHKFIEVLVQRVSMLPDIEQVNLTVIAGNEKATQLYSRFGFQIYGTERDAVKWKGKYFDEHFMVLKMG